MRLLFLHQNFPGQYRHLAPYFAARPGFEVTGLGERKNVLRQQVRFPGVRVLGYQATAPDPAKIEPFTGSLQRAIHLGRTVARGLAKLAQEGYRPDLVAAHIGWGEAIFIKDVFPDAKLLLYCEFFYRAKGSDSGFDPEFAPRPGHEQRLRVMNTPLLMALEACDWGVAATRWQHAQFPAHYQRKISTLHDGIDTDVVRPDGEARFRFPDGSATLSRQEEIITYAARNLEPYRGFHIFMRAVPELLKRRPKARIVIVGGDDISYSPRLPEGQTYRQRMLKEMEGKIDWSRVHMLPRLGYADYLALLRVSSAHVYLTYPFIASWSMMEAMAAECLVIASRVPPVEEIITDGENGLLVDFFSTEGIAARVDEALRAGKEMDPIRRRARQSIVERYDLKRVCLPAQARLVEQLARGETPAL